MARTRITNRNTQGVVTLPLPYGNLLAPGGGVVVTDDAATVIANLGGSAVVIACGLGVDALASAESATPSPPQDDPVLGGDLSGTASAASVVKLAGNALNSAGARNALGLGSAATHSAGDFDAAGAAGAVQSASVQKSANLGDLSDSSAGLVALGGAKAGVNTDPATPSFTPSTQIAAEMCDFGVVALPGVAVSAALTAGTTYPADPIAQPSWPCMLEAVTSLDYANTDDLVFIVQSDDDVNPFSEALTIPANTPGGTTISFVSNNNVLPVGTITAINCSAVPPGWTAGSVTLQTGAELEILPFRYYQPSGPGVEVKCFGEWYGAPALPLSNDGTKGTLARVDLGDGNRHLYTPAHVTGTNRITALLRLDFTGAGGSVGAHAHNQKAS